MSQKYIGAYTSRRVLTIERVNGYSIGNKNVLIEEGVELETVVENLLKAFLFKYLEMDFFMLTCIQEIFS